MNVLVAEISLLLYLAYLTLGSIGFYLKYLAVSIYGTEGITQTEA